MDPMTRRDFVRAVTATIACGGALTGGRRAFASALGLPLGLQLYSVREMLPKDYAGTLKQIGALGYQEVEAAGFYGHSAAEVKSAMEAAKLRCVSAHYSYDALAPHLDEIIAFHKELGAQYIICASPGYKTAAAAGVARGERTLEDWRWNASEFNAIGKRAQAAGLKFGYHNHTHEFHVSDGVVPYDELLRLTDPALVTFEMDAGWVAVGGGDPAAYLHRYADRISMLHVKDFKPRAAGAGPGSTPEAAELGRGMVDLKALFRAAEGGKIRHAFVEQEGFDMPPFEALKLDADYIRDIRG